MVITNKVKITKIDNLNFTSYFNQKCGLLIKELNRYFTLHWVM
jgi:hypothetical protein